MKNFDIIIIGAGPVGLANAYQLAKNGNKIAIVEQFQFKTQNSSSAGATRQFRLQYSEEYMSKLTLDSIQFWNELDSYSKVDLRTNVGSLWFGDMEASSSEGQIKQAIATMIKLNIPFEELSKNQIEKKFNFSNLKESYRGFFQHQGGTINVTSTLDTLHQLCYDSKNVTFFFNEKVEKISNGKSVTIKTNKNIFNSNKLLISSGPYSKSLLQDFKVTLDYKIWDMVSMYFKIKDTSKDLPSWFIFEAEKPLDPGLYYGFENCSWDNKNYLRVAPAFASNIYNDTNENRKLPNKKDIELTAKWVKRHLTFLDPTPFFQSNCLASIPENPAKKLYLDFVDENILHFSSGWAFKFVPILGKICSELLSKGETSFDISHFKFDDPLNKFHKTSGSRRFPF